MTDKETNISNPDQLDFSPNAKNAGNDLQAAHNAYREAFDNLKAILDERAKPANKSGTANDNPTRSQQDINPASESSSKEKEELREALLKVLWARDHMQITLEVASNSPFQIKRDVLDYLNKTDKQLKSFIRKALARADVKLDELRKEQPTPPSPKAWWWLYEQKPLHWSAINLLGYLGAIVLAVGAVVLITRLTQSLAIGGLDILSGASVAIQVVFGGTLTQVARQRLNRLFADTTSIDDEDSKANFLERLGAIFASWVSRIGQGIFAFVLALVFLVVVGMLNFGFPRLAAEGYNLLGRRAINNRNAAQAELYLDSATRLSPGTFASKFAEVGCLYSDLGAPDQAQDVFERVLEADSQVLLARYHLAQIYTDQGEHDKALRLATNGLDLLDKARADLQAENGDTDLPGIRNIGDVEQLEYLMQLVLGRAYFENGDLQRAKSALLNAETLFMSFDDEADFAGWDGQRDVDFPCEPGDNLERFIDTTEIDLTYFTARTFTAICANNATDLETATTSAGDARVLWRDLRGQTNTAFSRQDTYVTEAEQRLRQDCLAERTDQPVTSTPQP